MKTKLSLLAVVLALLITIPAGAALAHHSKIVAQDVPIPNCGAPGMPDCAPDCSDNCPWWNLWCMATCSNQRQAHSKPARK